MWLVRQQQQRLSTELWTHWLIAPALAADSWKITANLFNFSHSLISVQGFASSSCYMAFAPCCFSSTAVLTLWLMEEVTHLEYLSFSECCWGKEKLTNMTELLFLDWMHFLAKKKIKEKKEFVFFSIWLAAQCFVLWKAGEEGSDHYFVFPWTFVWEMISLILYRSASFSLHIPFPNCLCFTPRPVAVTQAGRVMLSLQRKEKQERKQVLFFRWRADFFLSVLIT